MRLIRTHSVAVIFLLLLLVLVLSIFLFQNKKIASLSKENEEIVYQLVSLQRSVVSDFPCERENAIISSIDSQIACIVLNHIAEVLHAMLEENLRDRSDATTSDGNIYKIRFEYGNGYYEGWRDTIRKIDVKKLAIKSWNGDVTHSLDTKGQGHFYLYVGAAVSAPDTKGFGPPSSHAYITGRKNGQAKADELRHRVEDEVHKIREDNKINDMRRIEQGGKISEQEMLERVLQSPALGAIFFLQNKLLNFCPNESLSRERPPMTENEGPNVEK